MLSRRVLALVLGAVVAVAACGERVVAPPPAYEFCTAVDTVRLRVGPTEYLELLTRCGRPRAR